MPCSKKKRQRNYNSKHPQKKAFILNSPERVGISCRNIAACANVAGMKKAYPSEAFRFLAAATIAPAESETADRSFSGIAYTGGVITDHWMAPVAFDLATMRAEPPLPILFTHDDDDAIGVADKVEIGSGLSVTGRLFTSIDADAKAIGDKADRGFPWGLSVRIIPDSIEEVSPGAEYSLNGATVMGPLTVFKNSTIREISFCSVAADRGTSASVFSGQHEQITIEVSQMAEPTQENGRDLEAELANMTAKFAASEARIAELTEIGEADRAKIDELSSQIAQMAADSRAADVKSLFSAIGREWSEDAARPYMAMSGDVFASVSADLKAVKGKPTPLPESLFQHVATGGDDQKVASFSVPHGFGVDQSALALHNKAVKYQADHPGIDYITAIKAVEAA